MNADVFINTPHSHLLKNRQTSIDGLAILHSGPTLHRCYQIAPKLQRVIRT